MSFLGIMESRASGLSENLLRRSHQAGVQVEFWGLGARPRFNEQMETASVGKVRLVVFTYWIPLEV